MIFGNWRPGGLLTGALMFGYTDSLRLRDDRSIHALLLLVAIALLAVRASRLVRAADSSARRAWASSASRSRRWYLLTDSIPRDFTGHDAVRHDAARARAGSQRLRMPAADGQRYREGSAG